MGRRVLAIMIVALLFSLGASSAAAYPVTHPVKHRAHAASTAHPAGPVQWLKIIAATPEGGVRQGNPNAPVKLVEYGSRGCPYCQRFATEGVPALRAKYVATGKVSYEYREFWIHPYDPGLSVLGHCVPLSSFFSVLDDMYAQQPTLVGHATNEMNDAIQKLPRSAQPAAWARKLGYVPLLTRHGVPLAKVNQCLGNIALLNKLLLQVRAGVEKGVNGTPSFFINGQKADAGDWAGLEPLLNSSGQ